MIYLQSKTSTVVFALSFSKLHTVTLLYSWCNSLQQNYLSGKQFRHSFCEDVKFHTLPTSTQFIIMLKYMLKFL